MTFPDQVIYVRKQLNLSRFKFAEKLSVTELTVYRWEKGISKPHISSIGKLMTLCIKEKIEFEEINNGKDSVI